jgi:hypothetical protein
VCITGTGKLQTFVANPNRQSSSEPPHQILPQLAWISRSDSAGKLGRLQELNASRDALAEILGQHSGKWVSTFVAWPELPIDGQSLPHNLVTQQLVDFRQNFLGVLNFHQFESPVGQTSGNARFWTMICHCRMGEFVVLQSFGSLWDRIAPCPSIAQVVDS